MKLFSKIIEQAPAIHVFKATFDNTAVSMLSPTEYDKNHWLNPYEINCLEGFGDEKNPYTYPGAAAVSPHYMIVRLWFAIHTYGKSSYHPLIQVNGWVLRVEPNGVTAADGHFTKLC